MPIGIYKTVGDSPVTFFGLDNVRLLEQLYADADTAIDDVVKAHSPTGGEKVKRVGTVRVERDECADNFVVQLKEQGEDDNVDRETTGKPTTGRKPPGASGSTAVQSLLFPKDKFSEDQCRSWIKAHGGFGDYGMDETENLYRFRQYDPEYFSRFRNAELDSGTGVMAVYGVVKSDFVKAVNARILKEGVRLVSESARVNKADGDQEERFIMSLVLEPNDGTDGAPLKPDTQGDIYSEEEVRKTAHRWMEEHGHIDLNHNWKAIGKQDVSVLESYIAPVNFELGEGDAKYSIVKGTWLLALRVHNDDLWKAIKGGEIGAYSIGGTASNEIVEEPAGGAA